MREVHDAQYASKYVCIYTGPMPRQQHGPYQPHKNIQACFRPLIILASIWHLETCGVLKETALSRNHRPKLTALYRHLVPEQSVGPPGIYVQSSFPGNLPAESEPIDHV